MDKKIASRGVRLQLELPEDVIVNLKVEAAIARTSMRQVVIEALVERFRTSRTASQPARLRKRKETK